MKKILLLTILLSGTALAQAPGKVQWTAEQGTGKDGVVVVSVAAQIEKGWHIYAQTQSPEGPTPLRVGIEPGAPYELAGAITGSKPLKHHDASFDLDTEFYTDAFVLKVPVKENSAAQQPVPITVRFQMCSDTTCMPPKTVHLVAGHNSPAA
jgi:hypothetical protein